jgi:hypothetical protein
MPKNLNFGKKIAQNQSKKPQKQPKKRRKMGKKQ